ncbi:hypothetical protein HD806DRAFT_537264 [Xylariaceae sp. AK1471]|nr:hypothetical protein HD806DRAFT_537264 [Xylariaceae sp. AK1471]
MATEEPTGPKPLNEDELRYVADTLYAEIVDAEEVLQSTNCSFESLEAAFTGWILNVPSCRRITAPKGMGKSITEALFKLSNDKTKEKIHKWSPKFIFLTVPDDITDPRKAWRLLLSTLVHHVSKDISEVHLEQMAQCGVYGGQFAQKHIDSNKIEPLIDLLTTLQNCDFSTTGDILVVVVDRAGRFSGQLTSTWMGKLKKPLKETLLDHMLAHVLFVDEDGSIPKGIQAYTELEDVALV